MHDTSFDHMDRLVRTRLRERARLTIADIGSYDVNGSYRPLFDRPGWSYVGMDMEAGPNVDRIVASPYRLPARSREFDVVVSGQAFEHVEFFWVTMLEIARILKPGGEFFLIAPSRGYEHRYPVDCWRFYPDGFRALGRWAGLRCVSASTDWPTGDPAADGEWGDSVGVFQKPVRRRRAALFAGLLRIAARALGPA